MMFSPTVISAFDELMLADSQPALSRSTTSTSSSTSTSSQSSPEYFNPLHLHPSNSPYSAPPCSPETLSLLTPSSSHEVYTPPTTIRIPTHDALTNSMDASPSSSAASSRESSPSRKQVHFALEVEEHELPALNKRGHRHWLFHSHLHSHEHSEPRVKSNAKPLDGVFSLRRKMSMRKISPPLEALEMR